MSFNNITEIIEGIKDNVVMATTSASTYTQLGLIIIIYVIAYVVAGRIRKRFKLLRETPLETSNALQIFIFKTGYILFPLLAILLLRVSVEISQIALHEGWLVKTALLLAGLILLNAIVKEFIKNSLAANVVRWVGIPLIFLQTTGLLADIIDILESISLEVGNINISAYGVLRVVIFGSLLFWLGRVSNNTGQDVIRRQEKLDIRTRELAAKFFEFAIYVVVFLLLLQVMGINLTALAVFSGAVGVGLGFGLQSIASNFISGIIILLDRSISIGDYIELEDGRTGIVREMKMRSSTIETFDGKDVMVPNEQFITASIVNLTRKDLKQRYRVDFSVAYHTDIRKLVDIIKGVVASHPQVLSGDELPIEERPDCEIDSFGDSGVNMFVEFWMEGIDDGKNRVGGDLLLMIFEALRENGVEIPFPQREVRILNDQPITAS